MNVKVGGTISPGSNCNNHQIEMLTLFLDSTQLMVAIQHRDSQQGASPTKAASEFQEVLIYLLPSSPHNEGHVVAAL